MWKTVDKVWNFVGEVVDPNAGKEKPPGLPGGPKPFPGDAVYPAGLYDHIFDIELGDNVMRRIPFNNGANALLAAERFVQREEIDEGYKSQI